jgi:hypothetical protein
VNEESVCTAVTSGGRPAENILFAPPCECPRCRAEVARAEETASADQDRRRWLRLPGDRHRHRVEQIDLGVEGRTALG